MDKILSLMEPVYFYTLLAGLLALFAFGIYSVVSQLKEGEKDIEIDKRRAAELEALLSGKEEEYKSKLSELETTINNRDEEHKKNIISLEDKLKDKEQLKTNLTNLEARLKEKEALFKKETASKDELDKKIKDLQDKLEKANKELSLKTKMYDGLKEQYDE
ncbi:MAG: hypothetical protein KJ842_05050, partial [Candidatus Omnitrophica bacterium]|nr:hypothetical protein [Candidatus Omnitrophota bacterium]